MRLSVLFVILFLTLSPVNDSKAADESDMGPVVLAIFAHADDESVVAPLLASFAREGAQVSLAIVTDGRFGVTEHAGIPAGDDLADIREGEARCATKKLGINPPYLLSFQDGFTHKVDSQGDLLESLHALHREVQSLFDQLRPEIVITWGPDGGYGHSDHRIVSSVVSAVFQEGTSLWPKRLLYPGFSATRLRSLSSELGGPMVQWVSDYWHAVDDGFLDVRVSYTDADRQAARSALACHASQYTPDDVEQLASLIEHLYDGAVTLRLWERAGDRE